MNLCENKEKKILNFYYLFRRRLSEKENFMNLFTKVVGVSRQSEIKSI